MKTAPKQADELTADEACNRFKVTKSQLADATLHARRLTVKQSSELGVSHERIKLYKEADVQALADELKLLRKAAKKRKQAAADSEQLQWEFSDTGGGAEDEIDDIKVAQHFKLKDSKLSQLPYRTLSKEESRALGKSWGRVRVYKLQTICQLVADLQERLNEKHEAEHVRLEGKQEAAAGKAFEAASHAKALVRSWKPSRLTAGRSPLPVELWGLVLQQLLTDECLWQLPATARELACISLTCKDMHLAVQQQGWAQLSSLLGPECPPHFQARHVYSGRHGQLPSNPQLLLTDPACLQVPELRDACKYYGMPATGSKAQLMVRVLNHFGTSYPCCAPLHLVAHKQDHASTVLGGIFRICQHLAAPHMSAAQTAIASELYSELLTTLPRPLGFAVWCPSTNLIPEELRSLAEEKAKVAVPRLQEAFVDFKLFQQLSV